MCDYSLHAVASRPAAVGDKLITSDFRNTLTRGFSAVGQPNVAVCLLPGTEIAFEEEVQQYSVLPRVFIFRKNRRQTGHKLARFRQINLDRHDAHHDAVEFPDGRVVLVTRLRPGQPATVLQLPARQHAASERARREIAGAPAHAANAH